jgi:predicted nucleic acid-binding protein
MAMKYLLDTNILIYYLNGSLDTRAQVFVSNIMNQMDWQLSIITKIELLGFRFDSAAHLEIAERLLIGCTFLPLSNVIVEKTIDLRQNHKLKTPDAIIAATAILNNMTLISRNDKDFIKIPLLVYQNPF